MMPIFPIAVRNQSRGAISRDGLVFGVTVSKGFDTPAPSPDDIAAHAQGAFRRMEEVLGEAGVGRADVVIVQVYLQDVLRDINGLNAVWCDCFDGLSPARCCIGATLQGGMLVEMVFAAEPPRPVE